MAEAAAEYQRLAPRLAAERRAALAPEAPAAFIPFPTSKLPPAAAANVVASAAAIGCDEALIALPTLSVLAAAVGNSHRIEIKNSWEEPAMIWTAIVSPSGTSKSPALDAALGPVYALEREAKKEHDDQMELYEEEARCHAALDKKGRANTAPPAVPVRRRYRVGDTTVEAICAVHAVNPRGLLMARDEGGGWLGARDRYANGNADSYNWNELGGGRQIVIDRKSNLNGVLTIERPAVSVAIGLQPGVLANLSPADLFSGFAARLLLTQPPPKPRVWTDAGVTPDVVEAYLVLVRKLYERPVTEVAVPLSPGALKVYRRWYDDSGRKIAMLPEPDPLRSALSKVEAYAARFALVFHLAAITLRTEPGSVPLPVSAEAMQAGVDVACWFRYELARIYDLHGFRRGTARVPEHRDKALAAQLPNPFKALNVQELWGVGPSGAYGVIKRLEKAGLVANHGKGGYAPLLQGTPVEKVEEVEKLESASLLTVDAEP
jgi:hypothetical protein